MIRRIIRDRIDRFEKQEEIRVIKFVKEVEFYWDERLAVVRDFMKNEYEFEAKRVIFVGNFSGYINITMPIYLYREKRQYFYFYTTELVLAEYNPATQEVIIKPRTG